MDALAWGVPASMLNAGFLTEPDRLIWLDLTTDASYTFPLVAENAWLIGTAHVTVRAGSAAQRLVAKPASRTWTVDTVPPETTITAKPPALTNDPSLRFEFSASEPDVDFTCKLDDGPAVIA